MNRAETFDLAIQQHSGAMLHYLFSLCNDWQIAEDLSQNLWKAVHCYFTEDAMQQKSLLYHKAKQIFLDYYRKTKRRIDISFTDEIPEQTIMPTRAEPENQEEGRRLFEKFWEIFYPDKYDETSKLIFWLHERYGYTMQEVSRITGVSKSTAHDKLKRLKTACKIRLTHNNHQEVNHA